jgi:hypothetical protein
MGCGWMGCGWTNLAQVKKFFHGITVNPRPKSDALTVIILSILVIHALNYMDIRIGGRILKQKNRMTEVTKQVEQPW